MNVTDEITSFAEVKTDEESIYLLCNSLNARQAGLRGYGIQQTNSLANLLLRAQATITKLYEENKALKEGKESEHHSPSERP